MIYSLILLSALSSPINTEPPTNYVYDNSPTIEYQCRRDECKVVIKINGELWEDIIPMKQLNEALER